MNLVSITAPAGGILSMPELEAHLRIDPGIEDAVLETVIAAVTAYLDGPEGLLGRALLTQTWQLTLDRFPGLNRRWDEPWGVRATGSLVHDSRTRPIEIPLPPLQSIESIAYTDSTGLPQTLVPPAYVVQGIGGRGRARILPAFQTEWPEVQDFPGSVVITFVAGYGATTDNLPDPIRHAARMIAASWFAQRETVLVGNFSAKELPLGAGALLASYREWGF